MSKERIIELRAAINEQVFLHERLGKYIQRLVAATRPYNPDTDWLTHSPSELVERGVDLGASPRAIICWGRLAKVWALLQRRAHRGLSRRHPGSGALHPQPPDLARPARREPRADDGGRHPGRRRAGAGSMRTPRAARIGPGSAWRTSPRSSSSSSSACSEVTIGDHRSRSHGSGFDFLGLRDWQAGRRSSSIDWAQSTLTNFSPLVVREFEQPSTATVVAIADLSASTRCGVRRRADCRRGRPRDRDDRHVGRLLPGSVRPRHLRRGLSQHLAAIRPRTGKSHVVHCLDAYQSQRGLQPVNRTSEHQHDARRLPPGHDDAAGDLRLPLRRVAANHPRAGAAERHARRVPRADRQRVRVRAAGGLGRLDRNRGRRNRAGAHDLAFDGRGSGRAGARMAGRGRHAAPRTPSSTSCASASIRRQSDIALSEFVAERRLRKTKN